MVELFKNATAYIYFQGIQMIHYHHCLCAITTGHRPECGVWLSRQDYPQASQVQIDYLYLFVFIFHHSTVNVMFQETT